MPIRERNQHQQTKITQITVNEESWISMGDSYHLHAHPWQFVMRFEALVP